MNAQSGQASVDFAEADMDQVALAGQVLAELGQAGAQGFDPVSFHYLDRLLARAAAVQGRTLELLCRQLAKELKEFRLRFEHAQDEARRAMQAHIAVHPTQASTLENLFQAGDFKAIDRAIGLCKTGDQGTPLLALVHQLNQSADQSDALDSEAQGRSAAELKTMRYFRKTWSALSVEKHLVQAFKAPPLNAGPINSHSLVLRSLAMMRDISPDYLNRFTSYVDTLLRLEQPGGSRKPAARSSAANPASQKPKKSGRGAAGSR